MKKLLLSSIIVAICSFQSLIVAQITVSPAARLVSATSGTTGFSVSTTSGWSVSDNASWLTATKTSGSNISVSYSANTSTNSRTASITATSGAYSKTVSVRQEGAAAFLDVNPVARLVASTSGSTSFTVSTNVVWSVNDNASWLSATRTSGSNISVSYSTNTSTTSRTATITATGTGGISETVTLKQAGAQPFLAVSPDTRDMAPESGSSVFYVSSNVGWSVSDDATWLTATKTDGNTISVSYSANNSTIPRSARITATGTGGITETVTLYQKDGYISFSGPPIEISAEAGSVAIRVSTDVSEWTVSDDASWVTVTRAAGSDLIDVSWDANPSTSPREVRITVRGTGEITTSGVLSLTQVGLVPYLNVGPNSKSVGAEGGTTTFGVSSNVEWIVNDDASWLTASKTSGNIITVSYAANNTSSTRTSSITVQESEHGSPGKIVTLTQSHASVSVFSNSESVGAESGTKLLYVSSNFNWSVRDNADWLTVTKVPGDPGTYGNTISASYTKNNSASDRNAIITVYGSGGITASETVVLTQANFNVSPNSRHVSAAAGTTSFDVDDSGVGWGVIDDASWLTASQLNNTISVSYKANTSTSPRTANITADGTGGVSEIVTVTQAGKAITFDLSPNSKNVSAASGTTSFSVNTNGDWSVSDNASWLIATKSDGITIKVIYDANTSTIPRTASIMAIGIGGISETVTVTQAGATASLGLSPNSESVGAASGSTSFSVSANVEWSVSDDASWLTATKSNGTTIKVIYDANTSTSPRTASIMAKGIGGISETVTVTQTGAAASLDVSPNSESIGAASGNTSFSVSANVEWSVSDDADWLTATKTHENAISVSFDGNTTASSRTAHITAEGNGGVAETVTLIQMTAGITFDVSPGNKNVSASSGTISFTVSSNVEWSVSEDADWLTATKTDETAIGVSHEANASTDPRTASITVIGTGGATKTVTVTQDGEAAYLDISPDTESVGAASGTFSYTVSSNVEWFLSENESWITASKTDESTITVSYEANTSTTPRTAYFGAFGTGAVSDAVELMQDGAAIIFNVSPNSESVSYESGTMSFSISSNVEWSVSDDAAWLTATKTDANTISVGFEANTSTESRSANITAEGSGGASETVILIQLPEGITFELSPGSENVRAESGTTSFNVNANIEWSVSDDAAWLTTTKTDETTIGVSYVANTSTDARTASITASGTGGASKTVTVTQEGAAAYLDLSSYSLSLGSTADSVVFTVFSNIDWTVKEDSEWLSTARTNDTTVIVFYDENTAVDMRSAELTLSAEGLASQIVTVVQDGTIASSIIDLIDHNRIIVYPNPTSNKIYITSSSDINSEVLISIFDGTGKLFYSNNVEKIVSNETVEIDISAYQPGVYILRLSISKSFITKKIIKQE